MPRRYADGFEAPPDDRISGAIAILLIGLAVAALFVGSASFMQSTFAKQKLAESSPTPTLAATAAAVSTPRAVVATLAPATATAPALQKPTVADWDIPSGHFFTQTNGQPPLASAYGFAVSNERGIPFWDEFRRLGGTSTVGYPLSRRFQWQGLETQVFQRAILQWHPSAFRVLNANVMDELHRQGKDQWLLEQFATPQALPASFDEGKQLNDVVRSRLALLDPDPTIRAFYHSVPDSEALYGLPASWITDMTSNWAIRLQRGVLQRWKLDQPWARAGSVTAANSGELAIRAGLLPVEPLQSEVASIVE